MTKLIFSNHFLVTNLQTLKLTAIIVISFLAQLAIAFFEIFAHIYLTVVEFLLIAELSFVKVFLSYSLIILIVLLIGSIQERAWKTCIIIYIPIHFLSNLLVFMPEWGSNPFFICISFFSCLLFFLMCKIHWCEKLIIPQILMFLIYIAVNLIWFKLMENGCLTYDISSHYQLGPEPGTGLNRESFITWMCSDPHTSFLNSLPIPHVPLLSPGESIESLALGWHVVTGGQVRVAMDDSGARCLHGIIVNYPMPSLTFDRFSPFNQYLAAILHEINLAGYYAWDKIIVENVNGIPNDPNKPLSLGYFVRFKYAMYLEDFKIQSGLDRSDYSIMPRVVYLLAAAAARSE